jgi:hypothetical protein
MNMMITEEALRTGLQEGPVTVEFIKKSTGLSRTMRCTTNADLIPLDDHPNAAPSVPLGRSDTMEWVEMKERDPNLFKVYDLNAQGWRSFRYESLTKVGLAIA